MSPALDAEVRARHRHAVGDALQGCLVADAAFCAGTACEYDAAAIVDGAALSLELFAGLRRADGGAEIGRLVANGALGARATFEDSVAAVIVLTALDTERLAGNGSAFHAFHRDFDRFLVTERRGRDEGSTVEGAVAWMVTVEDVATETVIDAEEV
jgi:hypothetical protein